MPNFDEILNAAQSLPGDERAQLIAALWGKLSAEDWVPPSREWIEEAQRRSDLIDAGEMTGSSWAEVRERARRQAGFDG